MTVSYMEMRLFPCITFAGAINDTATHVVNFAFIGDALTSAGRPCHKNPQQPLVGGLPTTGVICTLESSAVRSLSLGY